MELGNLFECVETWLILAKYNSGGNVSDPGGSILRNGGLRSAWISTSLGTDQYFYCGRPAIVFRYNGGLTMVVPPHAWAGVSWAVYCIEAVDVWVRKPVRGQH